MTGRIPIVDIHPMVECGRRPAKAVVGETFRVRATVVLEIPQAAGANVVLRDPAGEKGPWTPMTLVNPGLDLWEAEVTPTSEGRWTYCVEAWNDPIAFWRRSAHLKVPAGVDVEVVLELGAQLFERAAKRVGVTNGVRHVLLGAVAGLRDEGRAPTERLAAAMTSEVDAALASSPLRELVTPSQKLPLQVDRKRALFGSWYEFFPRSEGAVVDPEGRERPRSGTFRTAAERLPAVAAMGFDVVYLPPIHPIGRAFRKGPNNSPVSGPDDPGSPWAIGSPEGGHDAIHPDLGTIEDFDAFVARAGEVGLEIALDFALQVSPDHPWVAKHPDWFTTLPDGTIAYAENPPKKYQDIYPIAFDRDPEGITQECLRVLRHWMAHGVRIFRVDNPHTKPVAFWERVIGEINRTDPDVIFLSEAYSRPALKYALARSGFHQSYTYFTWRNSKTEIEEYLRELSGDAAAYLRPNLWVNTPDVLNEYLQHGGQAAFRIRAVLASTLSPAWGAYSGFELCENAPVRPGSEEYLDSEKYQYRPRDWAAAEREGRSLAPFLTHLNQLRRTHPALQELRNLHFHHADSDAVTVYSKRTRTGPADKAANNASHDTVIMVVNVDPHHVREATVTLDLPALGMDWHEQFRVRDELTGGEYEWGLHNYVRLDPVHTPAHIFTVRRSAW
jgi:starch synthase (maltosyl-transferring)